MSEDGKLFGLSYAVLAAIVVVLLIILIGAWYWYSHKGATAEHASNKGLSSKQKKQASDDQRAIHKKWNECSNELKRRYNNFKKGYETSGDLTNPQIKAAKQVLDIAYKLNIDKLSKWFDNIQIDARQSAYSNGPNYQWINGNSCDELYLVAKLDLRSNVVV
jgi:uncharacterized protein YxeA